MKEPRFSLRQLQYFLSVADHGSVAGAAANLRISPSAISDAVRGLEAQCGGPLFVRRKGVGAVPSALGNEVLLEARALVSAANDFQIRVQQNKGVLVGKITVGCMSTLTPFLLPLIISKFSAANPSVQIEIVEGPQTTVQRLLEDGRCDVAILYDDCDIPSNLVRDPLYRAKPKVVLRGNHPLAKNSEVDLRELESEPFIMIDIAPSKDNIKAIFKHAGVSPNIRYCTTNFELVRGLVARECGYSILVQIPVNSTSYDGLQLVARPIKDLQFDIGVVLCRRADAPPIRRLAEFSEACHQATLFSY